LTPVAARFLERSSGSKEPAPEGMLWRIIRLDPGADRALKPVIPEWIWFDLLSRGHYTKIK
jgi:hypothetical protein